MANNYYLIIGDNNTFNLPEKPKGKSNWQKILDALVKFINRIIGKWAN